MIKNLLTCIVILCVVAPPLSFAHGGRTDANGGHHDRKNGGYHYHGKPSSSQSSRSSSSTYRSSNKKSYSYSKPSTYRNSKKKSYTYSKPSASQSNKKKSYTYSQPSAYKKSVPSFSYTSGAKAITKPGKNKRIQNVSVVGQVDGDTIKVLLNGKEVKIRLYGIDTPEKKQAYGQAATAAIKQILNGRNIKIKILTHDKYGRAVAIVYADGKNVNELMVKAGYAWVYKKYCKDSFCNDWLKHEKKAKQSRFALWKDSNPEPPWEWRHRK